MFPRVPPSNQVALALFLDLQANVEFMQSRLQTVQRHAAKARRRDNPALLFRDLKDEPVAAVETLVEGPKAVVAEVIQDQGHVVLEQAVEWLPDAPFMVQSCPIEIHHAEPDALYGDVGSLEQGDAVCQFRCLADLPDVFAAFANEWTQRWVRVDHLIVRWLTRPSPSKLGERKSAR